MGAHEFRYEFQYRFIPKLVADVNDGYLPSTALHMVKGWDIWEEYEWEDGFILTDWRWKVTIQLSSITFQSPSRYKMPCMVQC